VKNFDSHTFEGCNYGLQPASIEDQAIIMAEFGVEPGKNSPEWLLGQGYMRLKVFREVLDLHLIHGRLVNSSDSYEPHPGAETFLDTILEAQGILEDCTRTWGKEQEED
jgi:hypothetical protein